MDYGSVRIEVGSDVEAFFTDGPICSKTSA